MPTKRGEGAAKHEEEIRNRVMHELIALKGIAEPCQMCKNGEEHLDENVFSERGKEFCIISGERVWTEEEAEEMTEEELKAGANEKAIPPAPTWVKLSYLVDRIIALESKSSPSALIAAVEAENVEEAVGHEITCAACGPLDTPKRMMAHIYALRGTTAEKFIKEHEEATEEIAKALKEQTGGSQS
jgi:hypothetical protein